jgi:hypothetical protein
MRLGDIDSDAGSSLRRYEQRLERSEKTTSYSPGTTRMAAAAHRARNRGASGDRRCLPESGRDRSASAGSVGTATAGKTSQRGDHWVGNATKPANTVNTDTDTENLSTKENAKAKPANAGEVTTGFGVELSDSRPKDPKLVKPFDSAG